MTRLTQYQKTLIVNAIMKDVPLKHDPKLLKDKFLQMAIDALPVEIRRIWDDEKTRGYINLNHDGFNGIYCWVPCERSSGSGEEKFGKKQWEKFLTEVKAVKDEEKERSDLRNELSINLATVRTVKQFTDRFPELVKYLPDDEKPVINLPTTTHMIDKLKEMGLQV